MLILGTTETIQLIDGADGLPTMQALRHVDQVVALGAPALAGARDAIIGEPAGPTQTRLKNRLEGILRKTREDLGSGLFAAPATYRLLPFSAESIETFGEIRQSVAPELFDVFDAQNLAIVRALDATIMLIDTLENRTMMGLLVTAGIEIRVHWIP